MIGEPFREIDNAKRTDEPPTPRWSQIWGNLFSFVSSCYNPAAGVSRCTSRGDGSRSLVFDESGGDVDRLPGDAAGLLRGQIPRHRRDLARIEQAALRDR